MLVLGVKFFKSDTDAEPVREWLKSLDSKDKKIVGEDIKTVQIGWPLGMPLVRKMDRDLWEVRISLPNRIARVLFTVIDNKMVLLHGFVKKSDKTPEADLKVAKARLKVLKEQT